MRRRLKPQQRNDASCTATDPCVPATALAISTTPAMAADGSGVSGVWAKRYSYWGGSDPYSSGGSSSSGSDSFDDSSSGFPGLSGTSLTNAIHYRTIHGILAVVAIVVLMPVGAVLMRIIPGRFAIWIHAVTQVLAYLLFVAGAALGIYLVQKVQIPFEGGSLVRLPVPGRFSPAFDCSR